MKLDIFNYHSPEANMEYMSSHQFTAFMKCPAKAYAILTGKWEDPDKVCYLTGGRLDMLMLTPEISAKWWAHNIQAMRELKLVSKAQKTLDEKLKALLEIDEIVAQLKKDPLFMSYLDGDAQSIMTPTMFGCKWKNALDVGNRPLKRIVDLKSVGGFLNGKQYADPRIDIWERMAIEAGDMKMPYRQCGAFYEIYNYWRQMAIYGEAFLTIHGVVPDLFIAAVSKVRGKTAERFARGIYCMRGATAPPEAEERLQEEIDYVEKNIAHVLSWKSGDEKAPRCNGPDCDYCESTSKTKIHPAIPSRKWAA